MFESTANTIDDAEINCRHNMVDLTSFDRMFIKSLFSHS